MTGFSVISAVVLGEPPHEIQSENSGKSTGVTIAIQKESSLRFSADLLERLD